MTLQDSIEEIWKDIPNYEGYYQVSSLGRVRSLDRKVNNKGTLSLKKGRILKQQIDKGYFRENLQLISHRENCSKDKKGGASKYVGVIWAKNEKKWVAQINIKGKRYHIGYFTEEKEAALAYSKRVKEVENEYKD